MTSEGGLTTLYYFTDGDDGGISTGSLVQDNNGNFYGTTSDGGSAGYGTIFR